MSEFNQPLSGNEMPRFGGIASLFRLPVQGPESLDIAVVGVPLDCGTSNRAGSRYGPRQIRAESVLVRPYGMATGAAPFDSFQIADTGDVALNTYNLEKSVGIIEAHFDTLLASGYLWEENRRQFAYKPFAIVQESGRGYVVAFTQTPTLRAYLDGLNVILANSIFRGAAHARPMH